MNWFRRLFGVDPIEAAIWIIVPIIVGVTGGDLLHNDTFGAGVAVVTLLGYAARRHFALRRLALDSETSGAWRMADVESRVAELEALHQRVAELEERLDFNERLLAQQHEAPRLEAPKA